MKTKYRIRVSRVKRVDAGTKRFAQAVRDAQDWKVKRGLPVAKYDAVRDVAYLEYADGRKEYIDEA